MPSRPQRSCQLAKDESVLPHSYDTSDSRILQRRCVFYWYSIVDCKALFKSATGAITTISQFSATVYLVSSKVRKSCKFLPSLRKGRGTKLNAYYDSPHFTLIPRFFMAAYQGTLASIYHGSTLNGGNKGNNYLTFKKVKAPVALFQKR